MKEKYFMCEEESEKLVENFIKVIEDASDYLFSLNHSQAYSYIGYVCGYLRYYYPLEFLSVMLNINDGNIDKTTNILEYMSKENIRLNNPKFRYSKAEYYMDKESNSIFKGIGSIKYLNKDIGDYLYSLRNKEYKSFIELLIDVKGVLNSRQLNILIELDYFSEFGKSQKLIDIVNIYNTIYTKNQFKKDNLPCDIDIMRKYASVETEKMFKDVNKKELCEYLETIIENIDLPINQRVKSWIENTGSCNIKDATVSNKKAIVIDINTKYKTPKIKLYNLVSGRTADVKIGAKTWREEKLELFDTIDIIRIGTKYKKKKIEDKWIETDEKEYWLENYAICKNI